MVYSLVPIGFGAESYVAPNGNDGDDGSKNNPWKTMQHSVNQLSPGDTLYLRGGRYSGEDQVVAEIYVAGTAGEPITIRNYSGETPVLSGTKVIDSGWQYDGNGVYKRVLTDDEFSQGDSFYPRIVVQNLKGQTGGNFLSDPPDPVSSRAEVNAPGLWYCDHSSHTLYVYPKDLGAGGDANDYTFEIGDLPFSITDIDVRVGTTNHLVIEGLTFFGFTGETQQTDAIWKKGAIFFPRRDKGIREYLTFKNLTFKNCWVGIRVADTRHTTVTECRFHRCIDLGIWAGAANGMLQENLLIEKCSFVSLHAPWPAYTSGEASDAALKALGTNGLIIRGCAIEGVRANRANDEYANGLWTDVDVSNAVIEENFISDVEGGKGIFVERRCDNNTVQRNLVVQARVGICIGTKQQPADDWPENCTVYHNTVVNCEQTGLCLHAAVTPVIANNIFVGNGKSQIMITSETLDDPRNANGGIFIDYNDCWEENSIPSGLYYNLRDWPGANANANDVQVKDQNAVSGLDNKLHIDPLFVGPHSMDFRLSLNSDCIDTGGDLGEPYEGERPDMGRYEFDIPPSAPTGFRIGAL